MDRVHKGFLSFLGVASLILAIPEAISANQNPTKKNDEITSGHMRGSSGHSGRGGGRVRSGGGTYIHGGGGRGMPPTFQPPFRYSQPGTMVDEDFPLDEIDEEEEAEVPTHELPDFSLSNETPIVHTGDLITVKVEDVNAEEPVKIFWRWNDENWQTGGSTFQKKATKPGAISISVVIQDGQGLYSQIQTTDVEALPQSKERLGESAKTYPDTAPQDNQKPSPPPPPPTDEETALDIFGLGEVNKEQSKRLKKELEKSISELHQLEAYIQADLRIQAACEADLSMIRINSIGADTDEPLKQEKSYSDCLKRVNSKLKQAKEEMEKLKKNIERLNDILK